MSFTDKLKSYSDNLGDLNWKGNFYDYLDVVKKDKKVARLTHARIYDMIMDKGVEKDKDGHILRYKFFEDEIFGCEKALDSLVEYFQAGAQLLDPRKRILLMMGPAGGGKSSVAILLKRGLEEYTLTEKGKVYAIDGCPMHEEPLHALPNELRKEFEKEYKVYVEGELCPMCQWKLNNEWGEDKNGVWKPDLAKIPVKRVIFSEQDRVGIGTFSPQSEKDQDISELIGSMDLSQIGEIGSESDPRAWKFDGELNIANRGVVEFIEMLKSPPQFLYLLLNLAQEQRIKISRYPLIYADEVIVSHTNEAEYQKFMAEQTNEALQDRINRIKVPYNLTVNDEEKIYDKLLKGSEKVHIAPKTTHIASMFAVLSRLVDVEKDKKVDLVTKMKLYNGEKLKGWTASEVRALKEENPDEGMTGIGPRFVVDALSKIMARPGTKCLNPIQSLRGLRHHLDYHPRIDKKLKEYYMEVLDKVKEEYHDMIKKQVMSAFVTGYQEQARALVDRYLFEVNAWRKSDKVEDPTTGEERDADEKFMRSVEEEIGISESASKEFREEVVAKVADLALDGRKFDYTSHQGLSDAIEKKLFSDVKSVTKAIVSADVLDKDQEKRLDQVIQAMKENGYCEVCARETLKYLSKIID